MSLVPLTKDTVRGPIQRVAVRRFHFGDGVGSGQEFFNDDLALRVGGVKAVAAGPALVVVDGNAGSGLSRTF